MAGLQSLVINDSLLDSWPDVHYPTFLCPLGYARAAKEPYLEPSVSCSWSSSLVFLCI